LTDLGTWCYCFTSVRSAKLKSRAPGGAQRRGGPPRGGLGESLVEAPETGVGRWSCGLMLLLVLGLTAALGWREETSYDLGSLLTTGQWILRTHSVPIHDLFTYTVSNHPYVDLPW